MDNMLCTNCGKPGPALEGSMCESCFAMALQKSLGDTIEAIGNTIFCNNGCKKIADPYSGLCPSCFFHLSETFEKHNQVLKIDAMILVKNGHQWIFRFPEGDEEQAVVLLAETACNPHLNFDRFDATACAYKMEMDSDLRAKLRFLTENGEHD